MDQSDEPTVERLRTCTYRIPTDGLESDGTFVWRSTTLVLVEAAGGGQTGLGFSYTTGAAQAVIEELLRDVVVGTSAMDIQTSWIAMRRAVRNVGRSGLAASAIAAVDVALWDLKAKLLGASLGAVLGQVRDAVPAYGSGGFTSYSIETLGEQLGGWARDGFSAVKMKVGREPARDADRVAAARDAIGADVELYVDANGAYDAPLAAAMADRFAEHAVSWFEEPVTSDALDALHALRARVPPGMRIAAGEYAFDALDIRRLLEARAVDVVQIDATRCCGVTGFLAAAALADVFGLPVSAHTAPSLHAALCCAAPRAINVEYFHDHARIEQLLFDGAAVPRDGMLMPDRSRPGLGLALKQADAARYAA